MSETTRASLECGWCGDVAIYGDADGLFGEDDGGACISCGFPGRVGVEDYDLAESPDGDRPAGRAYWNLLDGAGAIAKWEVEHPEMAARMARETAEAQQRWAEAHPELAARAAAVAR